jgi:hypothetical protein
MKNTIVEEFFIGSGIQENDGENVTRRWRFRYQKQPPIRLKLTAKNTGGAETNRCRRDEMVLTQRNELWDCTIDYDLTN